MKKVFKNTKQKFIFLFIVIASIALITLILGLTFIGVGAKEYGEQVAKVKDNLELNSLQQAIADNEWKIDGLTIPDKWKEIIVGEGQDTLKPIFEGLLEKTLTKIDVPLFSYGIFLIVMTIISSIGTGLYGNSIFNKKYQNQPQLA